MTKGEDRCEIVLTSKGLERTTDIEGDKFWIVMGGDRFECNRFQAAFMSKAIHRAISADSTITEFEIVGYESNLDVVNEFSRLMKGSSLVITESNCENWELIARVLENDELLDPIIKFETGEEALSLSNCLFRFELRMRNRLDTTEELKFIAAHFYEFDSSALEKLQEFDILEQVISSDNLCLKDEDSLVEFISLLGEEYSNLFDYVECQFLSLKGIDKFLSKVSLEKVKGRVWESICRRLRCEISNRNLVGKRFSDDISVFAYCKGGDFKGILHWLTNACG
jgi:hypothetical protein